ncbi:MAG: TetR/AcrR family transcriptional regulator [Devosia nanyangense]|uniref:TetR/AcrR family transcriptional regulator n=1 Tax=Devosia nanyangense TaxID=1228055 RepID=A0A933KX08_9HYPH|nr:TetR/AcrR family transcriptional regulator [Devosia nanyangense]
MAGRRRVTREAIVEHARRVVADRGAGALTFQALAAALGVSKQAIIYWYPSKWELIRDSSLPALKAEADTIIRAVALARTAPEAIERCIRALVAHHLADLGSFRMLYLAPQFDERASLADPEADAEILVPIHQTTSAMYAALEARLAADSAFCRGENPRRLAVAVHMAGIGLLTMVALADSVDDPLAHGTDALVGALIVLLTAGQTAAQ